MSGIEFGKTKEGNTVTKYLLKNKNGMEVAVMDLGATIVSVLVPDREGVNRDVVLGYDTPQEYQDHTCYFGAVIGRNANRIGGAKVVLDGKEYQLEKNDNGNNLHSGKNGFNSVIWNVEQQKEDEITFSYLSKDLEQDFPGNMTAKVTYTVTDDNALSIAYEAVSDQTTVANFTNHAYFNLENTEQGSDVRNHTLRLNADFYLPVDGEGIPNSPLKHVVNTSFDFRVAKPIAQDFQQGDQVVTKGYDHSFIVNKAWQKPCVLLTSPNEDLSLEVLTSQAALQVYTGNYLAGTPTREGGTYQDFSGIALETQCLPDTPNHPEWQNYGGIQKAGERYYQWTEFRFK